MVEAFLCVCVWVPSGWCLFLVGISPYSHHFERVSVCVYVHANEYWSTGLIQWRILEYFCRNPLHTSAPNHHLPFTYTRTHATLVFVSPSTTPIVSSAWMLTHPRRFMVGATRVYGGVYHFQAAINLRLYLNPAFREKGKALSREKGGWRYAEAISKIFASAAVFCF